MSIRKSKNSDRYDTSQLIEAQFKPGSRGRVLRNLLGITSKREMDKAEAGALKQALDTLVKTYDQEHQFTAKDIRGIHKLWLSSIYPWAGKYRQVNLMKGDFPFAFARQIPNLMQEFENEYLENFTPCRFSPVEKTIKAIAIVHTELVLIHPFREGNGRVSRVLATLMANQAGLPFLNFESILGKQRQEYFAAVRYGLDRNYAPMEKIFSGVIRKTISDFEKS